VAYKGFSKIVMALRGLSLIVNSYGYICCVIKLMSSTLSWNFNLLLNAGLIRRLSLCSLIGEGNMSVSIPTFVSLALLTKFLAPILTNKTVLPSENIDTLLRWD
jgi:hypothetical protein